MANISLKGLRDALIASGDYDKTKDKYTCLNDLIELNNNISEIQNQKQVYDSTSGTTIPVSCTGQSSFKISYVYDSNKGTVNTDQSNKLSLGSINYNVINKVKKLKCASNSVYSCNCNTLAACECNSRTLTCSSVSGYTYSDETYTCSCNLRTAYYYSVCDCNSRTSSLYYYYYYTYCSSRIDGYYCSCDSKVNVTCDCNTVCSCNSRSDYYGTSTSTYYWYYASYYAPLYDSCYVYASSSAYYSTNTYITIPVSDYSYAVSCSSRIAYTSSCLCNSRSTSLCSSRTGCPCNTVCDCNAVKQFE